jgi:hypothetical protein
VVLPLPRGPLTSVIGVRSILKNDEARMTNDETMTND